MRGYIQQRGFTAPTFIIEEYLVKTPLVRKETEILQILKGAVTAREKKKGQLHKIFKDSFDAKASRHDEDIQMIFGALKKLLTPPLERRHRIGFKPYIIEYKDTEKGQLRSNMEYRPRNKEFRMMNGAPPIYIQYSPPE